MEHIELFAGCGGLSLGLESAGFKMLFANELSPMAAETFAYNLLDENLLNLSEKEGLAKYTLWINSRIPADNLKGRLRENPQLAPRFGNGKSEIGKDLGSIKGKLLVGSIIDLNKHLEKSRKLVKQLRDRNIDLVSGGPPCQSFSLAGLRQLKNKRNTLPMDFADFVGHVQPKVAMLENVSGILRAFKLPDGSKHFAWFEVARAFSSKGYVPLCLHVNAKYSGAAQNRPRFILLAFREDVFLKIDKKIKSAVLGEAFDESYEFYQNEMKGVKTKPEEDLNYHDLEKGDPLFLDPIFSPLSKYSTDHKWHTVHDAIDDLRFINNFSKGVYASYLDKNLIKPNHIKGKKVGLPPNHELRSNSPHVQKRFKLYQYLGKSPNGISTNVTKFLQDPKKNKLSEDSVNYLLSKRYLLDEGSLIQFSKEKDLEDYLIELKTKKQTQRVLKKDSPAPAALSIPDDACHYHAKELRTLTVREMARFQSFPDWFEFRSKVTTGGQMRKFEVPQYTQVGNAVPPLLGKALGETILNLLKI